MTRDQIAAILERNFIKPPKPGSDRTTCPQCSASRSKPNKPCMKIREAHGIVFWYCHHCKEDGNDE